MSKLVIRVVIAQLNLHLNFQAAVDCAVDPPKPGDPSFELYNQEKHEILSKLGERADLVTKGFQTTPGVECSSVEGAMYAFPKVILYTFHTTYFLRTTS